MPIYEYRCSECGHEIEAYQKIKDPPLTECGECSGQLTKLISRSKVMSDIQPYQAVTGDMCGKWITSRSQHREFLKRNDLVEVGNEKEHFTKYGGKSPDNPNLLPERKHEEQICQSIVKNLQILQSR